VLSHDEPFDFDGAFYQVHGAFSGVKPVQSPRPVISLPAESPEAVTLAARYGDVVAFHGASRAKAAEKIAQAKQAAAAAGRSQPPGFWVNLNMLTGETDEAARQHLHDLEASIRHLQEHRSAGPGSGIRSIREDRFADVDSVTLWEDGVLYLGLTKLSRATPTLVGAPATIADAVLAYHDLGIGVVTLGSHVTSEHDAGLRAETLRLIKQAVAVRDAAAARAA
jgi:alkanesulfonate monooxygenase